MCGCVCVCMCVCVCVCVCVRSVLTLSREESAEVIVITDGASNTGLGSLDRNSTESDRFYRKLAKQAVADGTKVMMIGFQLSQTCGEKSKFLWVYF